MICQEMWGLGPHEILFSERVVIPYQRPGIFLLAYVGFFN